MEDRELESGAVGNIKQTTKSTMIDGKKVTETVTIDKDTGKLVKHTVDGKNIKNKKPPGIPLTLDNYHRLFMAILMEIRDNSQAIRRNLQEINYRMDQEHPLEDKKVEEVVDNGGH